MSQKCTPLWGEAYLEVKMYKPHHSRTAFGSCDVAKVYAAVARSTFRSQHVQSTPASKHFWKLRCRKSARHCGPKHISKSKVLKLPVPDHFWTFRCRLVRQVQAHCQKWAKREGFVAASTTTTTTLHSTPLHCTTLHCNHNYSYNYNYNYITLRYASLQYTNYIALHYTPLQYTTLQYTNYNYNHNYYYITLH